MNPRKYRTTHRGFKTEAAKHKNALAIAGGLAGVFFALEFYFLRELLAAELLFLLGFAVLCGLLAVFYLIGVACEEGLDRTNAGAHLLAHSARRSADSLELAAGKLLGHPRHGPASGSSRTGLQPTGRS